MPFNEQPSTLIRQTLQPAVAQREHQYAGP
jgi:hypothetical protein